jgi:RimJ/RimL family protein N-acetyltransferase
MNKFNSIQKNAKEYYEGINPSHLNFCNSHFFLRPIIYEDLKTLFVWRNEPLVSKYLSSSAPEDMDAQVQWYEKYLRDSGSLHLMAIKRSPENIPVGYCQLFKIDKDEKSAEFGIVVGNIDYMNTGLAFKLTGAFFKIVFTWLGFQVIYGCVHPQNKVSIKFHNDFMGSKFIEGPHKYRKDKELLFEVNKLIFESFEEKLLSRSKKWQDILNIEQRTPATTDKYDK